MIVFFCLPNRQGAMSGETAAMIGFAEEGTRLELVDIGKKVPTHALNPEH